MSYRTIGLRKRPSSLPAGGEYIPRPRKSIQQRAAKRAKAKEAASLAAAGAR